MEDDEYAAITKKPLKLSTSKDKTRKREDPLGGVKTDSHQVITTTTTKAEEAFRSKQKKIVEERILKKASKTHKQRVEEFNKHLDSLSEHYDIPKVGFAGICIFMVIKIL